MSICNRRNEPRRRITDRNYCTGYGAVGLLYVILVIACVVGWVMNIIKLVGSDFTTLDGMEVLRIVGIFIGPLGGVLGYL